jgi:hypothetical protein
MGSDTNEDNGAPIKDLLNHGYRRWSLLSRPRGP